MHFAEVNFAVIAKAVYHFVGHTFITVKEIMPVGHNTLCSEIHKLISSI